ncbi:hypothetical protein DAPPUDRAFT_241872 [Daphnia pulex]|uniref:Uncharacterized protein n=1 Tax=Daphnia pulex TaxID=6669 RepID=E9GF97_DAPPU|nr:hypothetical protein DAPPUDRAFT_241872 [Daphnia pulex]|eukprot:EFX81849.1 hypothetical protein DAPPUDRAFT_241872 [Daphnia pulex]
MLENARAAEAADRYAESVEQLSKQATNSKPETTERRRRRNVANVEDNGLTQEVRARQKTNVEIVDMTGRIPNQNRARQTGKKCESFQQVLQEQESQARIIFKARAHQTSQRPRELE